MRKTTPDKTADPADFSDAERADLGALLTALKVWWLTPLSATGEAERLRALIDAIEAVRGITTERSARG